ncbi:MAG: gamma-glutamyltransferase [Bacteroidales bacterium]|jgi:gamma-glutamyltranspeptidase/glutathione hydrolase|nr:gamma-glutamyltransferase [Bacteroidales bacterium]MDI9552594.1 gamma-glutamyltransferase [Bacteroidota bacterium]MZP65667.1 gamma-glutamyltransferase [Bacteroidales bacterium]NLK55626.1 gamma-glutamyltransferase [Bacteroidales bacterium]HPB12487.1 gamma-glutamyltransferase [Bacteroidales bacterium]
MTRKIFIASTLLLIPIITMAQDRVTGRDFATRSEVIAQNGMAATSQPLATQAAIDILQKGGNAIDAAIAANAVLGVVEPTGCGIGGDLFAIIWSSEKQKLYGLNASGRSPRSLKMDYFKKNGYQFIPATGPLPVSVPGCVDGWYEMHELFGRIPMRDILQPAINYARNGFPVTEVIAFYLESNVRALSDFPNIKETYMPKGKVPAKGEIFKNPNLANTLEKIAKGGRNEFYRGSIAKTIDAFMKANGGFLSYDDLSRHSSEWIQPVKSSYRGYDIWELPPNGQGIATIQILNILEGFDIARMGFGSAQYIHTFTEAKKLAFEDRAKYYADQRFSKVPVTQLISKKYAAERRKLINPSRAARIVNSGKIEAGNTIYLTVADRFGNMVSLIQSNYRGMGSGMCPTGLGFILQDRGEMFSLDPGHANAYAPGKRPFHTIIPGFITKNGKPWISFGVMGGDMQPQGHAQIIVNLIDFKMNLQEAGDAPRIYHTGSSEPTGQVMTDGGILYLESGIRWEEIRQLLTMGHNVQWNLGSYGGYQAIMWDEKNKVWYGASESRKDGQASGY